MAITFSQAAFDRKSLYRHCGPFLKINASAFPSWARSIRWNLLVSLYDTESLSIIIYSHLSFRTVALWTATCSLVDRLGRWWTLTGRRTYCVGATLDILATSKRLTWKVSKKLKQQTLIVGSTVRWT
jgi:hypothetical protein